MLATC